MTPDSVQELLNSNDYGDRLSGVNKLRDLDPAVAFEMIQPLIIDPNARVRYSAVSQMDTLGPCNRERARELLRERLMTDKELDVRAAAADAIAALKLDGAFEDLIALYREMDDNEGWLVKMSIIAALGEMGDSRAFEVLQEALQSKVGAIQTSAIGSLGELKDERAIPLLLPYATDEDWQIRHRVAGALVHFDSPQTRSALEQLAKDREPAVAKLARSLLA